MNENQQPATSGADAPAEPAPSAQPESPEPAPLADLSSEPAAKTDLSRRSEAKAKSAPRALASGVAATGLSPETAAKADSSRRPAAPERGAGGSVANVEAFPNADAPGTQNPPTEAYSSVQSPTEAPQGEGGQSPARRQRHPRRPAGKVAALPEALRQAIATRIRDGASYSDVIQAERLQGITAKNLSNWWNSAGRIIAEREALLRRKSAQRVRRLTQKGILDALLCAATAALETATEVLRDAGPGAEPRLKLQAAWVLPSIASTLDAAARRLEKIDDAEAIEEAAADMRGITPGRAFSEDIARALQTTSPA